MSDEAYKILGLDEGASADDIKMAYRRLVKSCHPDYNPQNEEAAEAFQRLNTAYETLISYTQVTIESVPKADYGFSTEDLLKNIFKSTASSFSQKKKDLEYLLKISFLEACYGTQKRIILTGTQESASLMVSIPSGVAHNQRLRFNLASNAAYAGVLLTVQVAEHPLFERDGLDVIICYPLTVPEYLRGVKVIIPTLWGDSVQDIAPMFSLKEPLRLKNRGIKDASGMQGDQLVYFDIAYPPCSAVLEEVLTHWERQIQHDPREKIRAFFQAHNNSKL